MDIHEYKEKVERYFGNCAEFGPDKPIVNEFKDSLARLISYGRIYKTMWCLKAVYILAGKPVSEFNNGEINKVLMAINDSSKWGEITKRDIEIAFRKFLRYMNDTHSKSFDVSWQLRKKNCANLPIILTKEEVEQLIEACDNIRDRAFIAALYDSGCRIGEFLNLKREDIEFDQYGALLKVNGKTGARQVRIISSVPLLRKQLENVPQDPKSYVWLTKFNRRAREEVPMKHRGSIIILKKAAIKAGLKKRVYCHLLRHSRATELAKFLTEAQLCEFFGWKLGSNIVRTYVHLSGRDVDEAVLKASGIKKDESESPDKLLIRAADLGNLQEGKLDTLLFEFLKVLAEDNPKIKEKFVEVVKQNKMEDLFK